MPKVNARSVAKASAPKEKPAKSGEDLWEFEQFVSQPPKTGGRSRHWLMTVVLLIIILVLAGLMVYTSRFKGAVVALPKFKAIYLDNGQVYYAQVVKEDNLNIFLDDVYYIETKEQVLPASEEGKEPQRISVPVLVKRTDAPYKPQGWLQINRQKVVAIEALGDDSQILQEIEKLNKE